MGPFRPNFPKMTSSSEKRRQGKEEKKRGGVGGGWQEKKEGGVGRWVGDDVIKKNKKKLKIKKLKN